MEPEQQQPDSTFRQLADSIPQIVWMMRPSRTLAFLNSYGRSYLGIADDHAEQWDWATVIHPDDSQRTVTPRTADVYPATLTHRIRRVDGAYRWHQTTITGLRSPDGVLRHWAGSSVDIQELRQLASTHAEAQRQVEEMRAILETLQTSAPIGVVFLDRAFRYVYINALAASVSGLSIAEHIGHHPLQIIPTIWPFLEPIYRRVLETGEAIVNQELVEQPRTRTGQPRYWLASHYPVEIKGQRLGVGAITIDITEQKRLEAHMQQVHKMEAVGRLASGIAHDFNNLLTVINGYTTLLCDDPDDVETRHDALVAIHQAGERAALLTRQLLTFSRRQVIAPRVLELSAAVQQAEKLLRRLLGEDIVLSTLALAPAYIYADPGQIEQVLLNLAINARDAMPRGGRLQIEVRTTTLDKPQVGIKELIDPGTYALLTVRDSGCGMDADTRAHVFEPFFTTKPIGEGTGLGLATVYGIVKQSKGFVDIVSSPGIGSLFSLYLPIVTPETVLIGVAPLVLPTRAGGGTILVVEDDPAVRMFVRRVLQRQGYTVFEACNGIEALDQVAAQHAAIDLVLTDVVLPHMSGRDLVDQLAQQYPGLAVLFMSGYTDITTERHGIRASEPSLLVKPFTPAELVQKVRAVLSRHGDE